MTNRFHKADILLLPSNVLLVVPDSSQQTLMTRYYNNWETCTIAMGPSSRNVLIKQLFACVCQKL